MCASVCITARAESIKRMLYVARGVEVNFDCLSLKRKSR